MSSFGSVSQLLFTICCSLGSILAL